MEQRVKFPELDRMKETRKSPVYHPEQEQTETNPINAVACGAMCVIYMATGIILSLMLDVSERWLQLLLIVFFCLLVGGFFGIMASAGMREE